MNIWLLEWQLVKKLSKKNKFMYRMRKKFLENIQWYYYETNRGKWNFIKYCNTNDKIFAYLSMWPLFAWIILSILSLKCFTVAHSIFCGILAHTFKRCLQTINIIMKLETGLSFQYRLHIEIHLDWYQVLKETTIPCSKIWEN